MNCCQSRGGSGELTSPLSRVRANENIGNANQIVLINIQARAQLFGLLEHFTYEVYLKDIPIVLLCRTMFLASRF